MSADPTSTPRKLEYVRLDSVTAAPRNPKGHDTTGIARAIKHHGFGEVPLRDERTGRLVAGHGRYTQLVAMRDSGATAPDGILVDPDGEWLMPVITGWASRSDEDAEAYLVGSNRLTTKGGWDDRGLTEMLEDLAAANLLELTGYDQADLDALLADLNPAVDEIPPAFTDPDDAPEPPTEPVCAVGDVWELGPHRVMCGDSTNPDHLAQLMGTAEPGIVYTDPPYGIAIVNDSGKVGHAVGTPFGGGKIGKVIPTTKYLPVAGDDTTDVARDAFTLLTATYPTSLHVWWGGNHYAASANLPDSSCWLVWDKETGENTFADAELAWTNHTGAVRLFRHMWNGMLRATERGKRVHPTQKPVALAEWAFGVVDKDTSRRSVLDVFGGSGSTLIAAHATDRTAYVMELEPAYCDVICRRYQEHTGTKPTRNGQPHDFTTSNDA